MNSQMRNNYKRLNKTILSVIGSGNKLTMYRVNGYNIFDIISLKDNKVNNTICHKCLFFIKEGGCKQKELNEKIVTKLCYCSKFFDKDNVKQTI